MPNWTKIIFSVTPKADPKIVAMIADHADAQFKKHSINTPRRQAHLLAHMAVETAYFTRLTENLNYSAKRLTQVWPKRFPTIWAAVPYAHNPKALAIKTYGGRLGNRPGTEDGWTFAGRGGLQTTGRANVAALAKHFGITPEECVVRLTHPDYMLECAIVNFIRNGAVPFADRDDISGSTTRVQGGQSHLAERRAMKDKFLKLLK